MAADLAELETRVATLSDAVVAESTKVAALIAAETQRMADAAKGSEAKVTEQIAAHATELAAIRTKARNEADKQRRTIQEAADAQSTALGEAAATQQVVSSLEFNFTACPAPER